MLLCASFDYKRASVDFVPEEYRHLPGDVFRYGLLDSVGVRRRVVPR